MRRLYIHIGYPKTGTTTLQNFLAHNAAGLAARGVLYPRAGQLHGAHYGINFALDIAGHARPADYPNPTGIAEAIAAEAEAVGAQSVVISSEYFITAQAPDRRRVKQYFAGYDVRIMCYLRRHDAAMESAYAQAVKTVITPPWHDSIQGFIVYHMGLGDVSYDYLGVLRQWAGVFGAKAMIVRPYEAAQNVPDLPGDFLAAIGVADGPDLVRPASANLSIGPRVAAAIRLVRRTGLDDERKRQVVGRLIMLAGRERERAHFLAPIEREAIIRRYDWMYRLIASEFLGRDNGVLFTAPKPSDADGPVAPVYSTEELVETILRAGG